jgi:hypothetical protein
MTFECEILEVKARKTGLDKTFKLVLVTEDERVLELSKHIAESTVRMEVKE